MFPFNKTEIFGVIFLLSFNFLVTITFASEEKSKLSQVFQIDDDTFEKALFSGRQKSELTQDELKYFETLQELATDPSAAVEKYKNGYELGELDWFIRKMTGLSDLDELDNPVAHTASETLEFMVDFIKKGNGIELKASQAILTFNKLEQGQDEMVQKFGISSKNLSLIQRELAEIDTMAKSAFFKDHIYSLWTDDVSKRFLQLNSKFGEIHDEYLTNIDTNFVKPQLKNIKELNDVVVQVADEGLAFSQMATTVFPRHFLILQNYLETDEENNEDDEVDLGMILSGKEFKFDVTLLERLCKSYQLLEGLKNQLLSLRRNTDDLAFVENSEEMSTQIFQTEDDIQKQIRNKEFRNLVFNVGSLSVGVARKMKDVTELTHKLSKMITMIETKMGSYSELTLEIVLMMTNSFNLWKTKVEAIAASRAGHNDEL